MGCGLDPHEHLPLSIALAEPTPPPQRAWRALCPQCGAAVDFRSAAAPMAVCTYCHSSLVREGQTLSRIGQVGDVFEDYSPLQLGTRGRHQDVPFTLIGRLQWQGSEGSEGSWNEWHALFDNGRSGWLSEDNGRYVLSFDHTAPPPGSDINALHPGQVLTLDGRPWSMAAKVKARLHTAQGELPTVPHIGASHWVVELRNPQGHVASWVQAIAPGQEAPSPGAPPSSSAAPPPPTSTTWSFGQPVELAMLDLQDLRQDSHAALDGKVIACPSCGASLAPTLASTQSLVCPQCQAVVDTASIDNSELRYFVQDKSLADRDATPLIPLGTTGCLTLGSASLPWQVVGYMRRSTVPSEVNGERSHWQEYVLYHRTAGFAFLVYDEAGWRWVRPISGAPQVLGRDRVSYEGVIYREKFRYAAVTTWVLGEFYWPVQRHQRTDHIDFEDTRAQRRCLNREESPAEVVWSAGMTLGANTVYQAFRIPDSAVSRLSRDVLPHSAVRWLSLPLLGTLLLVLAVVTSLQRCNRDDCQALRDAYGRTSIEYQQCQRQGGLHGRGLGGSYGGGGGGGHK